MIKTSSIFFQFIIFLTSTFVILFFTYLLGYNYLLGDSLSGNDSFSFYALTDWLSKFYPKVPFWFPVAGGGVSFTGYQWFSAYLINIVSHLSSLNLVQSFRIIGFLSISLTGVGIFVFCWTRLIEIRSVLIRQIIGLSASIFFVTAPVTWLFLTRWGFFAEQVSMIFIPWIMIFLDLFLERLFSKKFDFYFRLGVVGSITFCVLGFITHFYVVITTLVLFTSLFLIRFIFQKENKLILLKRIFLPIIAFVLLLSGAFIFRYHSYSSYTKAVAFGGLRGSADVAGDRAGTSESILTPKMMLSLEDVSSEKLLKPRDLIVDMRFPLFVWLLLIPTLIFGLFKSKNMFIFALLAVVGFIVNTNIDAYIFFSKFPVIGAIPIINQIPIGFLGRLFFVTGRFIIPIASAYGAFIVWELLFYRIQGKKFLEPLRVLLVLILGITTLIVVVFKFYNLPYGRDFINIGSFTKDRINVRDIWRQNSRPNAILTSDYNQEESDILKQKPDYYNIGDLLSLKYYCAFDAPGVTTKKLYPKEHICAYFPQPDPASVSSFSIPFSELLKEQRRCNELLKSDYIGDNVHCQAFYKRNIWDQLNVKNWPKFQLSGSIDGELNGTREFFNGLPKDSEYRYDTSGFAARTIMSTPLVNNNSQIQIYINSLSLIYNLANYQSQMMYSNYPLYQKPNVLTELAKWLGIKYVYLAGTPLEPQEYWKTDLNWKKISGEDDGGWREFQGKAELTTWDNRPKILVVADDEKNFYDETFKFFTRGGLAYEQALPVQGGKFIDNYSQVELSKYQIILMRAYGYKNKNKAYKLLDNYVKEGGKLIFDTGWQYFVPDFEVVEAPNFMPFDGLVWKNLDRNTTFNIPNLGDLTFGDSSWGVSTPTKLRDWAKVELSANDVPLVVSGNYGKGKVLWFGFNIIPHSEIKDNLSEVKLFNRLVTDLIEDNKNKEFIVEKSRPNPDKVEFILSESVGETSNLYFREAYYPDWRAKLVSKDGENKKLEIKRGGAGFMVISLSNTSMGDKVILEIKKPFSQFTANIVSILTFGVLTIYLFLPNLLEKLISKIPRPKITTPKFRVETKNEDEEY